MLKFIIETSQREMLVKRVVLIFLTLIIAIFPTMLQVDSSKAPSGAYYVDFSAMRYVAFGDSITFGYDSSRASTQMDEPYPKLIGDNQGISGATFCFNEKGGFCMTDRILSYTKKADIISVMLGVNDLSLKSPLGDKNNQSNQSIYGCMNLIATYLTTNYKDAFIFFMTPFKTVQVNNGDYTLKDIANVIIEVASNFSIPVLDMYNYGNYEREMYLDYSDGLHPTQKKKRYCRR